MDTVELNPENLNPKIPRARGSLSLTLSLPAHTLLSVTRAKPRRRRATARGPHHRRTPVRGPRRSNTQVLPKALARETHYVLLKLCAKMERRRLKV